ncbi:hypothetical protein JHD48_00825 [Sulfurimonas sp. SAG-AH-194-I05]|nr:hypothetical protein [Sulfurimonas sp. SAG-AH-194-I05]MDF1874271.1 hypothetical protein [Sulfurimonas sp. SAG-AH-194-I05]
MIKNILLSSLMILGFTSSAIAGVGDKTIVKNVQINTNVRSNGKINVGNNAKLQLGAIKIGAGSTVEGGSINSMVDTNEIKLGNGASADIGGVDIGH